jgi:hypothetical protein
LKQEEQKQWHQVKGARNNKIIGVTKKYLNEQGATILSKLSNNVEQEEILE